MTAAACVTLTTGDAPGAIALLQLHGPGARDVLMRIVKQGPLKPGDGRPQALAPGRAHLTNLADVDRGLVVVLRDDWVQIMPHGGLRVVEKIIDALVAAGAVYDQTPAARSLYPEAASDLEADMLAAIARAASPAAIDLLLAQPRLWRNFTLGDASSNLPAILARSGILDRLIDPPTVVVIGQPNVGKSTLTNRMLGRGVSVVADLPGTTRDWVAGLAELQPSGGKSGGSGGGSASGVAVRWFDTPGLRHSDDPIEQQAIELAATVIAGADVLIAMRDPDTDWPDMAALGRPADVRLMNKIDRAPDADVSQKAVSRSDAVVAISARDGTNLDLLERRVLAQLKLDRIEPAPWAFSPALKDQVSRRDIAALRASVGA